MKLIYIKNIHFSSDKIIQNNAFNNQVCSGRNEKQIRCVSMYLKNYIIQKQIFLILELE